MFKIDLSELTFIIPLLYDTDERKENLELSLKYITNYYDTNIIIMEEDTEPKFLDIIPKGVVYYFKRKNQDFFYRTKMLNEMTRLANTKYIAAYDCDALLPVESYENALNLLREENDFVYPFNGTHIDVQRDCYEKLIETLDITSIEKKYCKKHEIDGVGFSLFYNKESFIKAGMENENFKSWGVEDWERYERFKKLGYKIDRTKNCCYHIVHPRTKDSTYSNPYYKSNEKEFETIKSMNKKELIEYIKTWDWTIADDIKEEKDD